MANRIPKNFRLAVNTVNMLDELKAVSNKDYTDIIESTVQFLYEEYSLATRGKRHNNELLSQVLGMRVNKTENTVVRNLRIVNTL